MSPLSKNIFALLCAALCVPHTINALSSLTQNDPYPMFTALDPHTFLFRHTREELKGFVSMRNRPETFSIAFSPFGQNADCARPLDYNVGCDKDGDPDIEIGDIHGRWSMLSLLFGRVPEGRTLPEELQEAQDALFPAGPFGRPVEDPEDYFDEDQQIAFFSTPVKYRKRGLRFQFATQLSCSFGLEIEGGASEICQVVGRQRNLVTTPFTTPSATGDAVLQKIADNNPTLNTTTLVKNSIQTLLMTEVKNIAYQSGLDMGNFRKFAFEDLRFRLYWRDVYEPCKNKLGFPEFLIIPFVALEASVDTGRQKPNNKLFGLPSGNNGHNSIGASGGFNFDFTETVEFGCHVGATHFFARNFCDYYVPNNFFQQGLYPFKTDVRIQPGFNWEFGTKLGAFHLFDHFSFYIQYLYVHHERDKICLKTPDAAFVPEALERRTSWKNQFINTAFTYDISPCVSFGFLWQAPIAQRNAYRSSTILLNLIFTY